MLKPIVTGKTERSSDGETYEKKIASSYNLMRDNDGLGGFSKEALERLVKITESKSAQKEAEFVLVALNNCSGSSCKIK